MLYTHGDMVHSLPKHCAVSLGGTDTVPIQAAAYFAHVEECNEKESEIQVSKIDGMQAKTQAKTRQPYAFTFQGHPEYATDIGIQTFTNILKNMEDNDKLEQELQSVESDCVNLMKVVGDAFGWMDVDADADADADANANAKGWFYVRDIVHCNTYENIVNVDWHWFQVDLPNKLKDLFLYISEMHGLEEIRKLKVRIEK